MNIENNITKIKGIGEKTAKLFQKLGIETIEQLLRYYPREYIQFKEPISIAEIIKQGHGAIYVEIVTQPEMIKKGKFQIVKVMGKDTTGTIQLMWFNMPYLKNTLRKNERILIYGKIDKGTSLITMTQPVIYTWKKYQELLNTKIPVYSLTKGLTNNIFLKSMRQVLECLEENTEYLPSSMINEYNLMSYKEAIKVIHFPQTTEKLIQARKRLVFDEFLIFSLAIQIMKKTKKDMKNQYIFKDTLQIEEFINQLPYQLTNAQKRAWLEIKEDMTSNVTMNRLIQGDVGSGKTIIAAFALMLAALNGYQGCIMVPTEVLAVQHYETLLKDFKHYNINIGLLIGSMTSKEKKEVHMKIKNHGLDIIVGTHALIQEKVEYNNLALVITDEQHRFGVKQREALGGKGMNVHTLVMSATPIPRTLAVILYGDLDISIIDELPANRLPIKNCVVNTSYRSTAYQFIEGEVSKGRQVYIICPMVEESEVLDLENVIDYTSMLKSQLSLNIQIEYLHGKMKQKQKDEVMEQFKKNEIHVLVSTTVIEVGVNVPNATVMMIENAQRFGLAQLHQLRGRVGRGNHQSYCIFVATTEQKESIERLRVLEQSNDGFHIAEEDLRLRGIGDIFGIRQSGEIEFKIGDIVGDAAILKMSAEIAKQIMSLDSDNQTGDYEMILRKVEKYLENNTNHVL